MVGRRPDAPGPAPALAAAALGGRRRLTVLRASPTARAREVLWRTQQTDGSWESLCDMGAIPTPQVLVALRSAGCLTPEDAAAGARGSAVDNRNPGAPRIDGWAFQPGNETMVDNDATGAVLAAYGDALAVGALDQDTSRRVSASRGLGRDWLLRMQNPNGGWSAFVHGLPAKRPGHCSAAPSRCRSTIRSVRCARCSTRRVSSVTRQPRISPAACSTASAASR
jgi:squalene-hopene cyclase-like protein